MRVFRPAVAVGLLLAVPTVALTAGPAAAGGQHRAAAQAVTRHIVYVTTKDRIEEVQVGPGGHTGAPVRIAPTPGTPARNRPSFIVASPDGRRLAWTQARGSRKPLLFVRDLVTGTTTTVPTEKTPAGFAGDTLLVTFNRTFRLETAPKPHFVPVPRAGIAITGWPHGAVDVHWSRDGRSGALRLTTFGGRQVQLHQYNDFADPNYRSVDAAFVSPDGRRMLVERGNHQDFDGLGPTSLVDEFSLVGHHHRTPLGHYPGHPAWRVAAAAFRGKKHVPYVAWEAQTGHGVPAVVARFAGGRWQRVAGRTITVAADARGGLLLQPGRYAPPHSAHNPTDYPLAYPTADAALLSGGMQHRLRGVRGVEFFFAAG